MRSAKLKFCLICFSNRNIPIYSAVHFRFEELDYVNQFVTGLGLWTGYLFVSRQMTRRDGEVMKSTLALTVFESGVQNISINA